MKLKKLLVIPKFIKETINTSSGIISLFFIFIPEELFKECQLLENSSGKSNIWWRILFSVVVMVLTMLYLWSRNSVCIKGKNYNIKVSYGDIFEMVDCKKVIPFDEYFTITVGDNPSDIKKDSICGQYLSRCYLTDDDMEKLIKKINLKPVGNLKSNEKKRYRQGKIVPNDDYLLMSFAKLDKDGRGNMSRKEFLSCLSTLWEEIDKYYGQKDVCIPILGSGITRITDDKSLTQQELLDMLIHSYKLSYSKIKHPYCLHIVCRKQEGFSLNKIGESI